MTIENLEKIFRPASVALVRGPAAEGGLEARVRWNLAAGGFKGRVHTVGTGRAGDDGEHVFGSLRDVGVPVDLVISMAPAEATPKILTEAAAAGAGGLLAVAETPAAGVEREALATACRSVLPTVGLRLIGPGAPGIFNRKAGLNAGWLGDSPLPGKLAFISQSAGVCRAILDLAAKEQIGFSYVIAPGWMLDVDFGDLLDFIGRDPAVGSILMYVERLTRVRKFMSAARAVARVKPIVALAAGRGGWPPATGTAVGDDAVFEAVCARAGIVRVKTFEELFDAAEILSRPNRPSRSGLAIVTDTAGLGAMAVDALGRLGAVPTTLGPATVAGLAQCLPAQDATANPIRISGPGARSGRFKQAVAACLDAGEVGTLLLLAAPHPESDPAVLAADLAALLTPAPVPVFTAWVGAKEMECGRAVFKRAGIATFDTPERAVRAIMNLRRYMRNQELLQQIPAALPQRIPYDRQRVQALLTQSLAAGVRWLAPADTRTVLTTYGIPTDPSFDREKGLRGVRPATAAAWRFAAGTRRDPDFGPLIYLGESSTRKVRPALQVALPPLNRALGRCLIEATDLNTLPSAAGVGSAGLAALETLLVRVSHLVADFAEIETLDLDPLVFRNGSLAAVSARLAVCASSKPAPLHLAISSYPSRYERTAELAGVGPLKIRPIRPEDAQMLTALFETLSPRSVFHRFFRSLERLPRQMLARFTQIDYDREMTLVAVQEAAHAQRMLGVVSLVLEHNQKNAEFAVIVGDPWQGRGVGAALLNAILVVARERQIHEIRGTVLAENTQMLALSRRLGFSIERVPGTDLCAVGLDLTVSEGAETMVLKGLSGRPQASTVPTQKGGAQ